MTQGIIAAGSVHTAEAGAEVLRAGGNAVDAAVAATFASFMAEPTLVAPGGGGFALVFRRRNARSWLYDFFVDSPGKGLRREDWPDPPDFYAITVNYGPTHQRFHIGRASVATPGLIAGLCRLQEDLGRLPLSEALMPAIHLARTGVPLGDFGAYVGELLYDIFAADDALAQLFGAPDQFLRPDFIYKNPDLADFLEQLGREGPDLFYRGDVAQAILADQRAHGGLITPQDLAEYQVIVREPLHQHYRQYEFLTNPPPSRGGALIAFSLALLEEYALPRIPFGGITHLELLTEVMRQTNLARTMFEISGDAAAFLAPEHVNEHAIELARRLRSHARRHPEAPIPPREHSNTSHISVLDADGNLIALTTTAGETPGFVVPGTGLILNNILGEADLHPDGFLQGEPGQRIGSMMAPTLVLQGNKPVLAVGSGGANRIRSAILQVFLNYTDLHMDLHHAVEAPRIHFERNALQVEPGFPPETVEKLREWGYDMTLWPTRHMFFGGAHAVGLSPAGYFEGAGDSRRLGAVVRVI
ncbi:MAG TPA: gamma-glutamyltransferase [Caldilineae bacterium]|nr:gamma-glutamyltransferase [Caldilineae bacterium]